jgi:hypothetical protein
MVAKKSKIVGLSGKGKAAVGAVAGGGVVAGAMSAKKEKPSLKQKLGLG